MTSTKNMVNFVFEMGTLKHVQRSGWWLINVHHPESVAEHSFRAAVIGYLLAEMEHLDPHKVGMMCLFNDLHEARLNDLHKVGHRYIDFKKAETEAHREQTAPLGQAGRNIFSLHTEFQRQESQEAILARDADLLENAFQAKEYLEIGYKDAQNWIDNIRKIIKTDSARKLLEEIERTSSNEWWKNLKKVER